MSADTNNERGPITLPLENAVLCVDCEMVSNSAHDVCVVCGSHSLLNLDRMLGGTVGDHRERFSQKRAKTPVKYHLDLQAKLRDLAATELNAIIDAVTHVQSPTASGVIDHMRINVESVVEGAFQVVRKVA